MECQICQRAPAVEIRVRRQQGLVALRRVIQERQTLCREHGFPLVRTYLRRTLLEGWWGLFSFFSNFWCIGINLVARSRVTKLGEPQGSVSYPAGWEL